jgi:hypothetical protein
MPFLFYVEKNWIKRIAAIGRSMALQAECNLNNLFLSNFFKLLLNK